MIKQICHLNNQQKAQFILVILYTTLVKKDGILNKKREDSSKSSLGFFIDSEEFQSKLIAVSIICSIEIRIGIVFS